MDKSLEVMLFKQAEGSPEGLLTIRCSHRKTELIVKPGEIIDSGGVRIKLDDSAPLRQTWGQATNYQGLFAPDAIALARQLTKTKTLLFEYQPFQQRPHTVEFKVGGLAAKLQALADACEWAKLDEAKARAQQAARLEAERTRKREAMIRVELLKHVELCRREALREKGYWCWYDEADEFYKNGGAPAKSKEGALENAIETANTGVVFKRELSQIDAQLK
jgi:type VI secretion system (T6SS) VasI/EvfG family protein